jgi:hypothetical protein
MFPAWPTRSPVTDGVLDGDREKFVILSEGWPDLYRYARHSKVRAVAGSPRAVGVAPPVDGHKTRRKPGAGKSNHLGGRSVLLSEAK